MRSKKRTLKYWIGQLHLWLGLGSGIVVLIVSITGCLFVFQKEISEAIYHKTMFIEPEKGSALPLSGLQKTARDALGAGQPVNYITTYADPGRAWEFMAYKSNDTALTYFGAVEYYRSVFINPYTGAVTGIHDYKYDFFSIVKYIHWSLLLNTKYGQPVVGWSTLIFVLLLITGLILWWPKRWNKANRNKSFRVKWKAKFKRLNYDLHNVLGFYSMLIALILALTGMVWAFQWFQGLVYVAATGTATPPQVKAFKSAPVQTAPSANPIDIAFQTAITQFPGARRIGVEPAAGKEATIEVQGYKGKETYYDFDELKFDQYSGKLLNRRNESERNRGERLIYMNYDIHVGAIWGLPGKILAFIASLIAASLPVTGFYIWWGRRKKKHQLTAASPANARSISKNNADGAVMLQPN